MYYCYILKSLKTGQYYVGSSENFENRLQLHNSGKVKSTKSNRPWEIVYFQNFQTIKEAYFWELQIKGWKSRKAVERLISTFSI